MPLTVKEIVELVAIGMLPLGYALFMWHRIASGKSIGARAIQFMAVIFLLPVIIVLALEGVLDGQTIGTLIGGLTGYLLSGIANYDKGGSPDA